MATDAEIQQIILKVTGADDVNELRRAIEKEEAAIRSAHAATGPFSAAQQAAFQTQMKTSAETIKGLNEQLKTVQSSTRSYAQAGMAASYAFQDFTSVQGSFSQKLMSIQNNLPMIIMGLGGPMGLAAGISAVSVALGLAMPAIEGFVRSLMPEKVTGFVDRLKDLQKELKALESKKDITIIDVANLEIARKLMGDLSAAQQGFNALKDAKTTTQEKVSRAVSFAITEEGGGSDEESSAENVKRLIEGAQRKAGTFFSGKANVADKAKFDEETRELAKDEASFKAAGTVEGQVMFGNRVAAHKEKLRNLGAMMTAAQTKYIEDLLGKARNGVESARAEIAALYDTQQDVFTGKVAVPGARAVGAKFRGALELAEGGQIKQKELIEKANNREKGNEAFREKVREQEERERARHDARIGAEAEQELREQEENRKLRARLADQDRERDPGAGPVVREPVAPPGAPEVPQVGMQPAGLAPAPEGQAQPREGPRRPVAPAGFGMMPGFGPEFVPAIADDERPFDQGDDQGGPVFEPARPMPPARRVRPDASALEIRRARNQAERVRKEQKKLDARARDLRKHPGKDSGRLREPAVPDRQAHPRTMGPPAGKVAPQRPRDPRKAPEIAEPKPPEMLEPRPLPFHLLPREKRADRPGLEPIPAPLPVPAGQLPPEPDGERVAAIPPEAPGVPIAPGPPMGLRGAVALAMVGALPAPERPEVEKPEAVEVERPEVVAPPVPGAIQVKAPEVRAEAPATPPAVRLKGPEVIGPEKPRRPEPVKVEGPEVLAPRRPQPVRVEAPEVVGPEKPQPVRVEGPKVVAPRRPEPVTLEGPEVVGPEKPGKPAPVRVEGPEVIEPERPQPVKLRGPEVIAPAQPARPGAIEVEAPEVIGPKPPRRPGPVEVEAPEVRAPKRPAAVELEAPRVVTPEPPRPVTLEGPEVVGPKPPDAVKVEAPEVVAPERPDAVRVEGPEVIGPKPRRPEPVRVEAPRVIEPRRPEAVKVEGPEVIEPERPQPVKLRGPEVIAPAQPARPGAIEVEAPEVIAPEKPEPVRVEAPEVRAQAPRRPDAVKVEAPEVIAPEKPEPADNRRQPPTTAPPRPARGPARQAAEELDTRPEAPARRPAPRVKAKGGTVQDRIDRARAATREKIDARTRKKLAAAARKELDATTRRKPAKPAPPTARPREAPSGTFPGYRTRADTAWDRSRAAAPRATPGDWTTSRGFGGGAPDAPAPARSQAPAQQPPPLPRHDDRASAAAISASAAATTALVAALTSENARLIGHIEQTGKAFDAVVKQLGRQGGMLAASLGARGSKSQSSLGTSFG